MKTPGAAVSNEIINTLNQILELELAGVVKYTHYSLMVFGHNRIPIVSWMKDNANEGLVHAQKAGDLVTLLGGGHPSLKIAPLLETEHHNIGDILRENSSTRNKLLGPTTTYWAKPRATPFFLKSMQGK